MSADFSFDGGGFCQASVVPVFQTATAPIARMPMAASAAYDHVAGRAPLRTRVLELALGKRCSSRRLCFSLTVLTPDRYANRRQGAQQMISIESVTNLH